MAPSKIKKAIAAFVATVLTLPFAAWITGDEVFTWGAVGAIIAQAFIVAFGVYIAPRNEYTT